MLRYVILPAVLFVGVALAADDKPAMKETAKNPGFEKLKSLAGDWLKLDDKGNPTDSVGLSFKVTSAGKAVQETIVPGQQMEMVTMYYVDGKDLKGVHYCAMGNQPHLKLDPSALPNTLKFDFDGGSNMDPAKDMHMHEGAYKIIDADHIEASWQGYVNGKPAEGHGMTLKLVRKKK